MVRIQIRLENRTWQGVVTSALAKMIAKEYFLLFAVLFMFRNLVEIVTQCIREHHPGNTHKGLLSLLILSGAFLASGGTTGYYLFVSADRNFYAYCLGMILFVVGYLGRQIAIHTLGRNYSQSLEVGAGHELVTSGIYAVIRHPLAAFYLVEMLAFVMIRRNPIALIALGVVFLTTLYRIRAEEQILAARFGRRFKSYRRATKKLIPFLY